MLGLFLNRGVSLLSGIAHCITSTPRSGRLHLQTVVSLGSLCSEYILIIQYCYTGPGGYIQHKSNGTYILFSDNIML